MVQDLLTEQPLAHKHVLLSRQETIMMRTEALVMTNGSFKSRLKEMFQRQLKLIFRIMMMELILLPIKSTSLARL